ncbi:hypothetical protein AAFF_G00063950 [Aldrovandia affinis]|uniref:Uncharacterized protein n=1 Tax=Aldrovandia affinis TaxID=143900 RepID=A0AAD7T4W6_9TELE|nr:hypothetical protein AAFF_G00063950 [Aldrovandia affinis]
MRGPASLSSACSPIRSLSPVLEVSLFCAQSGSAPNRGGCHPLRDLIHIAWHSDRKKTPACKMGAWLGERLDPRLQRLGSPARSADELSLWVWGPVPPVDKRSKRQRRTGPVSRPGLWDSPS